jgi:hypothetical protein
MTSHNRLLTLAGMSAALVLGSMVHPAPLAAHCDSMDGPVVKAAKEALKTGNINLVLVWVRPQDEPEIRAAFSRVLDVRQLGPDAQALADYWFFETLVRVHRQGEGEPFTGLKPAGYEPPEGISAADRAIELGSVDTLAEDLAQHAAMAIRERFERVLMLRDYDSNSVPEGREWVEAYVEFIHFVEGLHGILQGEGGHEH